MIDQTDGAVRSGARGEFGGLIPVRPARLISRDEGQGSEWEAVVEECPQEVRQLRRQQFVAAG